MYVTKELEKTCAVGMDIERDLMVGFILFSVMQILTCAFYILQVYSSEREKRIAE